MAHTFMFMPILATVLFLILPREFALATYLPISAFSLVVAYKAMRAQRQPPVSGQEAMVGDQAVVIECGSSRKIKVRYRGEIWRAHYYSQALYRGQQVRIESVNGLTLWVKPLLRDGT